MWTRPDTLRVDPDMVYFCLYVCACLCLYSVYVCAPTLCVSVCVFCLRFIFLVYVGAPTL